MEPPQHDRVAALDRQRRAVDGHIRSRLVDDGDDPERHPHLAQVETAGERAVLQLLAHRVGELGDRPHAFRHRLHPRVAERQPVAQRLGEALRALVGEVGGAVGPLLVVRGAGGARALAGAGHGVREIARRLRRAPSTISRELRRNAATRGGGLDYRATTAQWHADRSARRPKPAKLAVNVALRHYVQERLAGLVVAPDGAALRGPAVTWKGRRHGRRQNRRWATAWSPEQIARRLPLDFPDDGTMRISHEAIYQALYVQGRGALRRELTACLRTGRALRVPRARSRGRGKSFVAPEILISERPAEAADRAVPGHWEGDLILGLGSSAIGTLVERATRFTMLLHLPPMAGHGDGTRVKNGPALAGHGAEAVRDAITRTIATLPEGLRRSLTWDQGAEMASTRDCGSTPAWRSTSATRTARGSAARTRTPTACCATFQLLPPWPALSVPALRLGPQVFFVRCNDKEKRRLVE